MTHKTKPDVAIVNPNLLALKMAEGLADLRRQGIYQSASGGFYEQPKRPYREEFLRARPRLTTALGLTGHRDAAE